MKRNIKILSLLMAVLLAFSIFPFSTAYAVEGTETVETRQTEEFALPDIVPEEEAVGRGYIGRVKEEEKDNYTFVFKDSENMRTMRVYSHPVKYTDKDGNTKDITLDIQSRPGGGFETKDNSIKTTFGAKLSDGIRLQSEDVDVKLIPANSLNQATLSEDNKTVSYTLDEKTTLEYSLTYTGFKEDIVVNEYTGQTEYEFLLYTNGLTVKEEMGSFYLADSEGNRKANIGDIIIFTADERNNTLGELSCIEIKENQIYGLTIHVDAEYLKDEKTVYPIRIDPTLEVTGTGAIEDVSVCSVSVTYSGTSGTLYVGAADGVVYRSLMRFPNIQLPSMETSQLISATVELRDVMCQDVRVPIECRQYNAIPGMWYESGTTTWNSVGGDTYVGDVLDEQIVYYGNGNVPGISQRYSFDISDEVVTWITGSRHPGMGLIFKTRNIYELGATSGSTVDRLKYFGSYNRNDYKPSLSIEYSNVINSIVVSNAPTGAIIKGTSVTLNVTTVGDGAINWSSSNSNVAYVSNQILYATGCGATTITATFGSASYSFLVGVKDVSDGQKQSFTSDTQPIYIRNMKSGRYLDIQDQTFENGANACLWDDSYAHLNSQQFRLKYIGEGYYVIIPHHNTNLVLCVEDSSLDNWAHIELLELSLEERLKEAYPNNALWKIVKQDGIYTLQSKCSNKYLDCYNGNTGNGTQLIQYSLNYNSDSDVNLNFGWAFESTIRSAYNFPVLINSIKYAGSTAYTEALSRAEAAWNQAFDDVVTSASIGENNIIIYDINDSTEQWVGQAIPYLNTIKLNRHYLDTYTVDKQQNTIMHEMGHILGLDHNPCDSEDLPTTNDNYHCGNIMYPVSARIVSLSRDDKYSLDSAYYDE